MALADFLNGAGKSVQQLLLERQLEQMGVSPAQLAQRNQSRLDQEMALRQQEAQLKAKEFEQNQARLNTTAQNTNDLRLGDLVPPGNLMAPTDPLAQSMGRIGLAQQNTTLPSTQMTGTDLGRLTTRSMPSDNVVQSVSKLPSEKQIDTTTDNTRQAAKDAADEAYRRQAHEDAVANFNATNDLRKSTETNTANYRGMTAAETARHNKVMEGQGQERIDKPPAAAAAGKLGQRDNDTVVTIHQMMPRINEVVSDLQKTVSSQPAKKPGLLGQIGEKVERVGQGAAYKMGLAQPSDVSKRIQLESLMQVLGTVPYLRGTRNYQFIQQIQQHLADPTATDAANLERLQQLQRILPEMEQAIYDVQNHGVIPHEHGANYSGPAPAAGGFSVREIK